MTSILAPTPTAFADAVDGDYVNVQMRKQHIPGLSLVVVRDGKVELLVLALRMWSRRSRATSATVFQIQSITKTFTSTAILQLVQDGKLSLDDPISKHLDGTPDAWKPILIRHLLSHTSGISGFHQRGDGEPAAGRQ